MIDLLKDPLDAGFISFRCLSVDLEVGVHDSRIHHCAATWLSVAGGNSVMPPWVCHQFPEAGVLVRRLRDTACDDPDCAWCRERHDARKELARWFRFTEFLPEPTGEDGRPLQQTIVEAAMLGEHLLGILPTGSGKSLCYQIPALSRYDKIGALTVVISPLVALMADQIAGLEARGITSCTAINGLLSMPERADALDRVRLGDVGILIVSPEQLRSRTLQKVLAQREIGTWVLDEAHCLSKWGHDFRPDYRYVGRFIREKVREGAVPPILCLTATANPDVVTDIISYFQEKGLTAEHFHARLKPETKKSVQERFIRGELRGIVATNAFGMGIDKSDVRLVIHADIPGSLENYMQEAGRAGRDRKEARCVLLYTPDDVERQFGMSAHSRLKQRDIQAILKSLRRLDRKKKLGGEVVATAGEILTEEVEGTFERDRDSATDDTRVRTAISWLEEAALGHVLLDSLPKDASFLRRAPTHLSAPAPELARHYLRLTPRDVDMGYSGRYTLKHAVHQAIATLSAIPSIYGSRIAIGNS